MFKDNIRKNGFEKIFHLQYVDFCKYMSQVQQRHFLCIY